ncbi:response regulator [bacterium]|nr:response regulator [bacterium]
MHTISVLYAEDEFSNRELLRIKFEHAGIAADIVTNGADAIRMCKANEYDVVLLDHYMEDIDGIEAAEEIRRFKPGIPLIAITSDDSLKQRMTQAGFNHIVIKPLRGDDIIDLVRSCLR